ncbi:MAG: enoyl-CoA hydratase/isomerase family protein [Hyphomicrobiales bacterium]|nr:enoyl-CoA hydratase/isomerase family protein [Hyphomicrobiales bacterium]
MIESLDARLKISIEGEIALLVIDRPDQLNALDDRMVLALSDSCAKIEHRPDLRTVILTGAGDRSFCAGGDIEAWSGQSPEDFGRFWVREGHEAFDRLARLRQPVIAVLNGHTLGGGLELAACADYRIAELHVKIGQPETGLGIIPGWSGTQRVVRRFGAGVVRRMALFGDVYGAEDAMRLGLVDQVVERGDGLAAARAAAERLARRGAYATELTKMLINAAEGEETGRVVEALAGSIAAGSGQLKEGVAAFRTKRRPKF